MFHLSVEEWTALALSLRVAGVAVLASLPFAVAAAWVLSRTRFVGQAIFDGAIHLPLTLPPVVTGYLLLLTFGRQGVAGHFLAEHLGIVFSFRWTGAALAAAVMGFPLMVRSIRLSLDGVDTRLEEAAATLGARPLAVFVTVTLPLIGPGILSGMVLGFARAMGEFGATITFVSNIPGETQTLASAIYTYTQVPGADAQALRLTLVAIAVSMTALIASEWLARLGRKRAVGT
ncbi:molybdate transport system permease protein [Solimonas aquatica]|uniref:Molybdenum transport system permease n=1 Tax=Solimonas aquatica TaxID=489703 RepID=A0A1H9H9P7_9GAMM|nr:molybdate ABC transporter permease subunit [Solimonas aquatica]SEQ59071.1 molybdate transport system permease protein [Solimonas aquatica]